MAVFCDRSVALVADHEDAGGCFDHFIGDGHQLVDLQYSGDLRKQALKQAEVTLRDALDCGDGLGIGEVIWVQSMAKSFPMSVEDEQEFLAAVPRGYRTRCVSGSRWRGASRPGRCVAPMRRGRARRYPSGRSGDVPW